MRNRGEYEGIVGVEERIVADLITACQTVAEKVKSLSPLPKP